MNPQRDAWSEALRELASAAPEGSPELHTRLSEAFVHHHARRRVRQRAGMVAALAVCVAISAYWLQPRGEIAKIKVAEPPAQTVQAPPAAQVEASGNHGRSQAPVIAKTVAKARVQQKQVKKVRNHAVEPPPVTVQAGDFVALSTFDPAIPLGDSRMVRMDLPGSALRLIGYPIDGQLLDRRIVTDVLVGQDGMPYAVRLVQARNIH